MAAYTAFKKTHVQSFLCLFIAVIALAGCTLPSDDTTDGETTVIGTPVVSIAAPIPNTVYLEGVPVNIQAGVANIAEGVASAEILVDGAIIANLQNLNQANEAFIGITQTWEAEGIGEHTVSVTITRADGVQSDPQTVTISVVGESIVSNDTTNNDAVEPTDAPQATDVPPSTEPPTDAPTNVPPPTDVPPPTVPTVPTARFAQGINVRSGPGLNFAPPIGAFTANQTAEILSLNLDGTWFKVRFGNGEGWVFAQLATVEGNINNLPREVSPPTPIPTAVPPPTAIPATATPQGAVNLVVTNPFIDPPNPVCGQNFRVGMTIRNDGTIATTTGLNQIRDVHVASGNENATTGGGLVAVTLAPGATHFVEWTFNINTFFNERHRIEFRTDVSNQVAETNEGDNSIGVEYTLGACP
jgi:hypothetical protein